MLSLTISGARITQFFAIYIWHQSGGPTMSQQFEKLKNYVNSLEDDFDKFYVKGNKAAGTRVRKAMQDLKKHAQDISVDVQDRKNAD